MKFWPSKDSKHICRQSFYCKGGCSKREGRLESSYIRMQMGIRSKVYNESVMKYVKNRGNLLVI